MQTNEFQLTDDSLLVLYTDGLTELSHDVLQGELNLARVIDRRLSADEAFSARDLLHDVLNGQASRDDIAVLIGRWKPRTSASFAQDGPLSKQWRFHSSHARSAQTSRHELMSFIKKYADQAEDLFATEVILGELLANTVEHAPGLVEITIDWTGVQPILTVRDSGSGFADFDSTLPLNTFSEDGRGLYLIRELSSRFIVRAAAAFGAELEVVLPIKRTL